MDKDTMERIGIIPVKKMRNAVIDDSTILINKHSDGAIGLGYTKSVAELIVGGDIKSRYIQFGYQAESKRLYMWGDADGFAISYNKASSCRCYTSSKSLSTILPEDGYPYKCEVSFDPLAKCYFVHLNSEE